MLDEYGLHQAKTFTRGDRARRWSTAAAGRSFSGTPNGKNQFYEIAQHAKARAGARAHPDWAYAEYKASETGILDAAYLQAARAVMTADEYAQEFECSFEASVKGAIYAKELEAARRDSRITDVPVDPLLLVDTDWDLGIGDAMASGSRQTVKGSGQVRLIDYYEALGRRLPAFRPGAAREALHLRHALGAA